MFVMGDNRAHSEDSRFHLQVANGSVPLSDVVGPVVAVVWPVSSWQRFSPPATFADIPPAGSAPERTGKTTPVGPG